MGQGGLKDLAGVLTMASGAVNNKCKSLTHLEDGSFAYVLESSQVGPPEGCI